MEKLRVLVVEDEESILSICRLALRRLGVEVETAMTVSEAMARISESEFDLVLVDWILPDGSGLAMFKQIQEKVPQLLGILITGQYGAEATKEAFEAGFFSFLPKPFTLLELRVAVERAWQYIKAIKEREQLQLMVTLSELALPFATSLNLEEVLQKVIQVAHEQTRADKVSLMVLDTKAVPPRLRLLAAEGLPPDLLTVELPVGEGVAGHVAATGEPLLMNTQTIQHLKDMPLRYQGVGSALCLPLKVGNRVVGVLNLTKLGEHRPFSESDIRLYFVLATQAALAIENAQLHQSIREGYIAALASFAHYAETMEPYRLGHSDRVSAYARLLAEVAGMPKKEADNLKVAGLAHDLGLLCVPKEVLSKTNHLTEQDWELIRRHPIWSLELMERKALLNETVTDAIVHHHEHYDGTGYPNGLSGEQIPFSARLLAIPDTYDALTHDRPYRRSYPQEQAIEKLRHIAGKQLDPDLTELFLTKVAL